MVTIGFALDNLLNAFALLTVVLYIHCQFVLYSMLRRRSREKLSSYFFIVFFAGFINLAVIANQVFFQLLPSLMWQQFFYSMGSGGARFTYMLNFGCEVFVIAREAFVAISRYQAIIRNDMSNSYWTLDRVLIWLFGISALSLAYSAIFFFCPFVVEWGPNKASVQFLFDYTPSWAIVSTFVPFILAVASCTSCIYCYYKVATIIKGSQTGLTKAMVAGMCLTSTIISLGVLLSLFVRAVNQLSFVIAAYEVIPLALFLSIHKIGNLIAVCGDPWILLALFSAVREEAFPCTRRKSSSSVTIVSTTLRSIS